MLILSILLVAIGLVVALMGVKLFRLLLPVIGLVTGSIAGYVGMQAVFGTGAVGVTLAIVVALMLGILLALLSFAFFDLAVIVYIAMLGAGVFSYLGIALGLNQDGFVVFLLGLTGAIIAGVWASNSAVAVQVVAVLTSFIGVAYVMAGIFLVAGNISLDDLQQNGVGGSIVRVVDQSFLWMLVWLGGSLIAWQIQMKAIFDEVLTNSFEYVDKKKKA